MPAEQFPTVTTEQLSQPLVERVDLSLLATKFTIPPVRSALVTRPRLSSKLYEALHSPLTLLAASPGFGKTTLLSTAIQQYHWSVAWLSLESGDDDLTRFWVYVFAALERVQPGVSKAAMTMLQSPRQPPIEAILTTFINSLMHFQKESVLVLDDYHVITAQAIHNSLTFLLDHLPPHLHLIIATRVDPPLPLARMRTRGQLIEIRSVDLRFTVEETALFLRQTIGVAFSLEDIQALETRTEGWIAGLQLAALALQSRLDVSHFVKTFTGSHRYNVDYLVQEVLTQQSTDRQTFLLQTSILDQLNGSLAEAITGQNNGQATLECLEQANLFLLPLDDERHWYRYHHLFAEVLRHSLQREQPELVPVLHRRACMWYEQHQLLPEAIKHSFAAADFQQAANLIERSGITLTRWGELMQLRSWLEALPTELVYSRPSLSVLQGWLFFLTGQYVAAERLLQHMEQPYGVASAGLANVLSATESPSFPETMQDVTPIIGEIAAIRASMAIVQGDGPRTIALSRVALAYLPEDNISIGLITWYLGMAYWLAGDLEAAARTMADACTRSTADGNMYVAYMAMHELASLLTMQGFLHEAERTYQQALQLANEQGGSNVALGSIYVGMGNVQYKWNNLTTAAHYLQEGIDQPGYRATANTLMGVLWPDEEPDVARRRLQVATSSLRSSLNRGYDCDLGGGYILFKNQLYQINPSVTLQTDVDKFLNLYQAGQHASQPEMIVTYEQACSLYRGPFLVEDVYEDWSMRRREQLS